MKTRSISFAVAFLLSVNCVAVADRELERKEILPIFRQLTSHPKKTWIPEGTIEAAHEEYRAPTETDPSEIRAEISTRIQEYRSNPNKPELTEHLQKMRLDAIPFNVRYKLGNEHTMKSSVVVRYDGEKFYWEINVDSRSDSVALPVELQGNFMAKHFDLDWNARRIFVWNGTEYTMYSLPGNHATVDSTGKISAVVNGPLTAGLIPWGYGRYTYESLTSAASSAFEKRVDGVTQIHITLENPDGSQMLLVLDPEKDFATISCLVTGRDDSVISRRYSDYSLVSGNWVPGTILVERLDGSSDRVVAYDLWNITAVTCDTPPPESFSVKYEDDAWVEYSSHVTDKPLMYRCTQMIDTNVLLAERLAYAATEGAYPQNCATASAKCAMSKLGKDVTDQQLAQLVTDLNGTTSLYSMKELMKRLGLYCRAVKTDIETLTNLTGCEAILHLPGRDHFVVLGGIDNESVWCIDLASHKFCYPTDLSFFGMDWPEGTALLISNQSIKLQGNFVEIETDEMAAVLGTGGYSCTKKIQNERVIHCDSVGGECGGWFEYWPERWGCEAAPSGSCSIDWVLRLAESPCIEDTQYPYMCNWSYPFTLYYMWACQPPW
ncbi:MAG: hypothetical protein JSU70_09980 [Phycisphaerales bacterium]|nr:MAG: hypothetical protein JSU70_09980 [Phycisphaerales bacterium]